MENRKNLPNKSGKIADKKAKDTKSIEARGNLDRTPSALPAKGHTAARVSAATFTGNVILFIFKLAAGVQSKSSALISDAVHTVSDVMTTVMVVIGIKISEKRADISHQYGHERIEPVISTILATVLIIVALGIGKNGAESIIAYMRGIPLEMNIGFWTFAVTAASIVFKEIMFQYTRFAAKKMSSSAMLADAWHHRSDALSSVAVLIGITGAKWFELPVLDPIASILVCVIIIKVGVRIYIGAVNQLIDKSASEDEVQKIIYFVSAVNGVKRIDLIRTRVHADRLYVDVEISVDPSLSVGEAHTIAELVHGNVEEAFPDIKHCMVHVNPYSE